MIVDAHHLLGVDDWLRRNRPDLPHRHGPTQVAAALDPLADDWLAYTAPFPSCREGDYVEENEALLAACADDSRLRAVAAVDPKVARSRAWLEASLEAGAAIHGLILWPILCRLDLRALARDRWFADVARRWSVPVTVHVAAGNEARIGRVEALEPYLPMDAVALAAALPDVRFNLSHVLRLSREALRAASELDNVWLDTSGLSSLGRLREGQGEEVFPADDADELARLGPVGALARLVESGWSTRLMFATTTPFNGWWGCDAASDLELVERACSTGEQQSALTSKNSLGFFRTCEVDRV